MPFPMSPVLTNFTGADESPLSESSAWSGPTQNGQGTLRRLSNAAAAATTGISPWQSYRVATFEADVEVFVTVPTLPASGGSVACWARITNPNNASTMQAVLGVYTVGTGWRIFECTGGSNFAQIGSTTASPAMAAGDKMGIEIIGTQIKLKHFTGGSWNDRVTATTTITGGGNIGLELSDSTVRADDFGGGNLRVRRTIHAPRRQPQFRAATR